MSMATTPHPTLGELEQLHRRIEEQAATSHWDEVDGLISERNRLLGDFVADERVAALRAAKKSTDRILALAKAAKLDVAGQLKDLQRGREATEVYRANR